MLLTTSYDAASRETSLVYLNANGQVLESFSYVYDSRGNRTSKIFADGTAEVYGYDQLSRLVRATYPSGRTAQYVYRRSRQPDGDDRGGPPAEPPQPGAPATRTATASPTPATTARR
jgi:YD repeat-containing protein